jgi:GT2 family glycosyltransferase
MMGGEVAQAAGAPALEVAIVTHESAAVLGAALESLARAAPRWGAEIWVVDNASRDGSADLAASVLGPEHVIRSADNRGYAAGVNRVLERARSRWLAILNPDIRVPPGALDHLAGILELHPRAALVGPLVRDETGKQEISVGPFPSLPREWAHAFYLERLVGMPGRRCRFPARTGPVDWVSGCAWLLRVEAARAVGPLDEAYFMYYEDTDYCRRLWSAGWTVLATPDVEVTHLLGRGSEGTSLLPADGGIGIVRYFRKFHPEVSEPRLKSIVTSGWRLRRWSHEIRAALGRKTSREWVRRFGLALEQIGRE